MNKKILITGAAGYIAPHLSKLLPEYFRNCKIYFTDRKHPRIKLSPFFKCDLTDKKQIKRILRLIKPHIIFHLAGSGISIKYTWRQFFDVNYKTTETLLGALDEISIQKPRIILIGSAAEYGRVSPDAMPIDEETPLNPVSPYGCAKALQTVLGRYYSNIGMDIIVIRPFNVIGQNMSGHLAIGNFQKQLKEIIEKKRAPRIYVGNIDVKRDYLDLTDSLRAFCLIAKKGRSGEIYNVCSGNATSLRYILKRMCAPHKGKIDIIVDKKLLRSNDVLISYGSNKKLRLHTGWKPRIPLEETIQSLYPR